MHRMFMLAGAIALAGGAQAQVANRLSREIEPNAIDRSLSASPTRSSDIGKAAEGDRLRAEEAAREAAGRRGLPSTSTLADGPSGIQRLGTGATPPSPATPSPSLTPQP